MSPEGESIKPEDKDIKTEEPNSDKTQGDETKVREKEKDSTA
jgi:hypothetical protein